MQNLKVIKNLKPIYLKNNQYLKNIKIIQDENTNKYSIIDSAETLDNENWYDEIDSVEADNENLFLLLNKNGKCGVFDYIEKQWIFKPQYDSIRFIDSKDSIQRKDGKTYMCVLEMFGTSGLFTFTKKDGKIIDRQSLIPADKYKGIQTNLFTDSFIIPTTINNLRLCEELIENYLFVELEKDEGKGCVVIKNTLNKSKYRESTGGEFETIMQVDCKYKKIRPSQFDGCDGVTEGYINGEEVYYYENMEHHIGDKNGVYYPVRRKIILNDREINKRLEQRLLLFGGSDGFGVLYNGNEIIPAKYSPQILEEIKDLDDDSFNQFTLANKDDMIYEYTSKLDSWNKYLDVKKYTYNQYFRRDEDELDKFIEEILQGTERQ